MQSRVEDILMAIINGTSSSELPPPQSRNEALLLRVLDKINEGGGGSFPIHICTSDEYDHTTGVPTIANPDEGTLYLVPASSATTGNLFDEWVYVDSKWELVGSANVDVPVQDVQVDGTSVVQDGVADIDTDGIKQEVKEDVLEEVEDDIPTAVASWLDEHVDPSTGYVVDDSLSIQGAAADAAKVGELKSQINALGLSVVDGMLCQTYIG